MDMRNRQQSRRNKSTDTEEEDPRCLLCSYYDDFIACFSSPLCYGDYCMIFISLGPGNLNKIVIFRSEGGLKLIFHLSHSVQGGGILHISNFFIG